MVLNFSPQALTVTPVAKLGGDEFTFRVPSDKSLTHRAIIFASMAQGVTTIAEPLWGEDCRHTLGAFRALGCKVEPLPEVDTAPDTITVTSPGINHWLSPMTPLDFGNSGTTARLLTGLFAARPGLFVTAFGDPSLSRRPMGRVVKPLIQWGAKIDGRDGAGYLPLAISGQELVAERSRVVVDKASAQVKSALLLAAMQSPGSSQIELPQGARNHTEVFLQKFGAELQIELEGSREIITLGGAVTPSPGHYRIPADPSSAAFFAAVAALFPGTTMVLESVLDNPTRCGFVDVLARMGLTVEKTPMEGSQTFVETTVDLRLTLEGRLKATTIRAGEIPSLIDEIPILAVIAAHAEGLSRFCGLGELRVKESDRLTKTAELVEAGGGKVEIRGDDLMIFGNPQLAREGFQYDPVHDHRLAMAASVWGLTGKEPCQIMGPECVAVSFPSFFERLESLV